MALPTTGNTPPSCGRAIGSAAGVALAGAAAGEGRELAALGDRSRAETRLSQCSSRSESLEKIVHSLHRFEAGKKIRVERRARKFSPRVWRRGASPKFLPAREAGASPVPTRRRVAERSAQWPPAVLRA